MVEVHITVSAKVNFETDPKANWNKAQILIPNFWSQKKSSYKKENLKLGKVKEHEDISLVFVKSSDRGIEQKKKFQGPSISEKFYFI